MSDAKHSMRLTEAAMSFTKSLESFTKSLESFAESVVSLAGSSMSFEKHPKRLANLSMSARRLAKCRFERGKARLKRRRASRLPQYFATISRVAPLNPG